MKPFRFVHTADLHLDSPFSGISYVDERVAERLREATFQTFDHIVDLCMERAVAFLLVAGDVYDSKDRSLRAQLRFRDGLIKLSRAGIPSFIVHGNHDPLDSQIAKLQWPDEVHVFGGDGVSCMPVLRGSKTIAHVYGISYPTQDIRRNLSSEFRRQSDSPFSIGLLHCNVGTNTGHEPYAPCTTDDLSKSGMDYWALGHVHTHGVLLSERPTIVYAGNPQGRHPGELGPRGCYLVEVNADGHCVPQFMAIDSVRWFLEKIEIEGLDEDETIVSAVHEVCSSVREHAEGIAAICRIVFTGRGQAHASLSKPGFVEDLTRRLRETEGNQEPFVWTERIEVETRKSIDVEALQKGQDFLADFLRLTSENRNDSNFHVAIRNELAKLFNSRLGRVFLEPLSDDNLLRCFDDSVDRCLDLLISEQD
jgi:exonuclease SbcD